MILTYLDSSINLIESLNDSDIFDKYTAYVIEHKQYVEKAYKWLRENCFEFFDKIDEKEFEQQIKEHDDSKFSTEEFEPYAQKWFGDNLKTPEYEEAWKHHWQSNPHHPEYWQGEDIPKIYILEMLCDWLSFSVKKDNISEIFDFYTNKAKDDPEKLLSIATKNIIEEYLSVIEIALKNND